MANRCAHHRNCPGMIRYMCEAYLRDNNCWETREIPCCRRRNKDRCETCPIYLEVGPVVHELRIPAFSLN